jgi:hypothetical protein
MTSPTKVTLQRKERRRRRREERLLPESISSGAQYVTLRKYFSHPSLILHSFATPPIKLKLGQQNRWGTTNSKPSGPNVMMDQSETLSTS